MNFPQYKKKHLEKALFSACDYLDVQKKTAIPAHNILCYQPSLLKDIKSHYQTQERGDIQIISHQGVEVGVLGNFGIGAPAAVLKLENLVARGGKYFISIGSAGSLQKDLGIGELALVDRAIRDEGTSFHYLEGSKYARASQILSDKLEEALRVKEKKYQRGVSWTTDAPYRETVAEVIHYQKEGVLTVEMEASALFSASQFLNVEMAVLLMISDSLGDLNWSPRFKSIRGKQLELFEVALEAITRR